jgi:mono/diheme cytochrome c family protein
MRAQTYVLIGSLLSAPLAAHAVNVEHGKALHDENCVSCHDTSVYTRPDRRIKSLDSLKTQVQRCEVSQALQWFDQDVDDVMAYLNTHFYKFDKEAKQ